MATFNKFNSFVEALSEKVHNLGADTLKLALCNAANAPIASNTILANLTQIAYTNLQSDPTSREFTATTSSQTSGVYTLDAADIVLTAAGGSMAAFQYVAIYNDTATGDELVGWYNYGSEVTLADTETFTITFDALGILTLT